MLTICLIIIIVSNKLSSQNQQDWPMSVKYSLKSLTKTFDKLSTVVNAYMYVK